MTESLSNEPGWLSGEIRGHVGWFPEAYVEKMDQPPGWTEGSDPSGAVDGALAKRQQLEGIQELPENLSDNGSINDSSVSTVVNQSAFMPVATKVGGDSSPVLGQVNIIIALLVKLIHFIWIVQGQLVNNVRVRALHAWSGMKNNHLSFNQGDVIVVSEKQNDWWFGKLDGMSGWFPKSYVTAIEEELSPSNSEIGLFVLFESV